MPRIVIGTSFHTFPGISFPDDYIITASGPGSALSFALTIAAHLAGNDTVEAFADKWKIDYLPA